ncbi:MAG: flavodoxin family protein [Oscillospiraceae bacterium]|nr:flavodoxin family protein [Oscillospiraceae bacterium]
MKKTLIVNGSPRVNGDTAALIAELRRHLQGEVVEISAYRSNIAPCVDCRGCAKTAKCVVRDDMDLIYADDFDNVVLASPVYFMTLPGQVLNLMSRFQPQHAAIHFLNQPLNLRPKKGGLILTAGGKGNEDGVSHHVKVFFRMFGASGYQDHTVKSVKTDILPAKDDVKALEEVKNLAAWLNED